MGGKERSLTIGVAYLSQQNMVTLIPLKVAHKMPKVVVYQGIVYLAQHIASAIIPVPERIIGNRIIPVPERMIGNRIIPVPARIIGNRPVRHGHGMIQQKPNRAAERFLL